jgi:hypothetical protein
VPVPLLTKEVAAYGKITREHLLKPNGEPYLVFLPLDAIENQELVTSIPDLIGRVVKHAVPMGHALHKEDLFPVGTQAGKLAAVEPGYRDLVLKACQIEGFRGLQAGARFDLVAAHKPFVPKGDLLGVVTADELARDAPLKVIVADGKVLVPCDADETKKGDDVLVSVAVRVEEVPVLTQALATGAKLICMARSGQVHDPVQERAIKESAPKFDIVQIEIISGGKREVRQFAKPRVPAPDGK